MSKTLPESYLLIEGRLYDVTKFKHPGGRVIQSYMNDDATSAFQQFHLRSSKARKYLSSIKSWPTEDFADVLPKKDTKIAKVDQAFLDFTEQLIKEGWFAPSYVHILYRISEVLLMFAAAFWLFINGYVLIGCLLGGLAGGRAGWMQHEGGHNSLTGIMKLDKFIQKFMFGFGLITAGNKWNLMHNQHHATAQREDFDPDLDTIPFVAFYANILRESKKAAITPQWWIRYQHLTFFVCTSCFNVLFWHFYLHPRDYLVKKFDAIQALFIVMRYVVHLYFAVPVLGWIGALTTLYLTVFLSGMYLFTNFSLSHTHLETVKKDNQKSWVEYALDHTVDIPPAGIVSWWMGYLNFQVFHHLWPSMPQFKQPLLLPRFLKWAKENNLQYQTMGYFEALGSVCKNLKSVANQADIIKHKKKMSLKNHLMFLVFAGIPTLIGAVGAYYAVTHSTLF